MKLNTEIIEEKQKSLIVSKKDYHFITLLKNELKRVFRDYEIVLPVDAAIKKAVKIATKNDLVLVTGSLYTAGDALKYYRFKTV